MTATVTVRPVGSPADFQGFLALVSRLHRHDPCWVPVLPEVYAAALSPQANPYFQRADAEHLLAWRGGEIVGHVVAHVNHALQAHQGNRWGCFGFFESEDDPEVAAALVDAVAAWLGARGCDRMVGPLQFSTREDPGVLVQGHDRRPVILQPWHPPYYGDLLEGAGLVKAKDVLWRDVALDQVPPGLLAQGARWATLARDRYGVTIRRPVPERMEVEMARVLRFTVPFFEADWGYVPRSEEELAASLPLAVQLLGPGTLLAEVDGELVGASMLVPDFRQRVRNDGGQAVVEDHPIDQARLMFMAVTATYRPRGVMPAMSYLHVEEARRRGIERIVVGWSYEDNQRMNVGMARLGLEVTRRHRIYEKRLNPSSSGPSGPGDPATRV